MLEPVLVFVLIGLLFIALAIPLLRRRVPPNAWYGLRVSATFADEEVWYEANARTARDLLLLGLMQLGLALGLPLVFDLTPGTYARLNAAAGGTGMVVAAIIGWRRANRLLEERRRERP